LFMNRAMSVNSAGAGVISLPIEGMHCASCVGRVEAALAKVEGVDSVAVNLATELATVHGVAPADALIAAVQKAGYQARVLDPVASSDGEDVMARKEAERLALKRELLLAVGLTLPVFILEMGSHLI